MIVVSGRLQVRKWKNKDGENRYSTEVVAESCYFGDSKKDSSDNGGSYGQQTGSYSAPTYPSAPASDFAMLDDDDAQLPF
jgi:single-strand DNA-binding protein